MFTCMHCGQPHPDDAKFCSATGQAVQPPAATARVRPLGEQKGVFDLFQEAAQLYRANTRMFLLTAAVLFLPGAFLKSFALSVIAAPALAAGSAVAAALNVLAVLINAFVVYSVVIPLTQGALTAAVADALLGGHGDWRQHWTMVGKRVPLLVSALLPAALLIVVGYALLLLPGIILSFLFMFVIPVVLIEGRGGTEALKRSYQLVREDLLRAALVVIAFGLMSAIAHRMAWVLVPDSWFFLGTFIGDLLLLFLLPIFGITSVLLYFDLRRKLDGLDDEHFKAELETLRPVV